MCACRQGAKEAKLEAELAQKLEQLMGLTAELLVVVKVRVMSCHVKDD